MKNREKDGRYLHHRDDPIARVDREGEPGAEVVAPRVPGPTDRCVALLVGRWADEPRRRKERGGGGLLRLGG